MTDNRKCYSPKKVCQLVGGVMVMGEVLGGGEV